MRGKKKSKFPFFLFPNMLYQIIVNCRQIKRKKNVSLYLGHKTLKEPVIFQTNAMKVILTGSLVPHSEPLCCLLSSWVSPSVSSLEFWKFSPRPAV